MKPNGWHLLVGLVSIPILLPMFVVGLLVSMFYEGFHGGWVWYAEFAAYQRREVKLKESKANVDKFLGGKAKDP